MKLSIITINLNNASGLRRTIESVIKQSVWNYEYIIIDGGSNDESCNVIKEYANKISYWVSEPDKGIYNGMNKGILKTSGDFLLFLNSGDFFYNDRVLETVLPKLDDYDIVYGNIIFLPSDFYKGGGNFREDSQQQLRPYPGRNRNLKLYLRFGSTIPHQAEFFRRTVFEVTGLYNESYKIASDVEFNIRCSKQGKFKFKYIPDLVSFFVLDGVGSDFSNDSLADKEVEEILKKYYSQRFNFIYRIFYFIDIKKAKFINLVRKTVTSNSTFKSSIYISQ